MIFEDAFMEIQANFVSLCLELVENNVDKIFIFVYQDKTMQTFNAFFKKDNVVKMTTDFGSDKLIEEFFDIGIEDINALLETCNQYKQKCPNEIKIVYDVKTKNFKATYGYQDYAQSGKIDPDEVLLNWLKEEKSK